MGADGGAQAAGVAHALHDARHVGGAVELAHLARHADVLVHQRLVVGDHVLGRLRGAVLDGVGRPPEQVPPQRSVQELQQREDARRPRGGWARRIAVEEEGEEPEPQRVSLRVESRMCGAHQQQNQIIFHPFSNQEKKTMSKMEQDGKIKQKRRDTPSHLFSRS